MLRKLLNHLTDYAWFRKLTDQRCDCAQCGAFVGYVVVHGHRHWLCPACAGDTQPAAVYR